jgi:hypothetical protein
MAAWPVVGFDGRIIACGNDDALDHPVAHLTLGHAATDDWETIRARTLDSSMMRAIRLLGPEYLAERYRDDGRHCDGYCHTCMALSESAPLQQRVNEVMERSSTATLEAQAAVLQQHAGALSFLRRYGVPKYAELATLGAPA